jgi:hypothetical protein
MRLVGLWSGLLSLALSGGCGRLFSAAPGTRSDTPWAAAPRDLVRSIKLPDGTTAPVYAVRFDYTGAVVSPESLAVLQAALREPGVTHVYVFCPGWESGWHTAIGWVETFAAGYEQVRSAALYAPAASAPATRPAYRPVYVVAMWPGEAAVQAMPGPSPTGRPRPVAPDVDRTAAGEVLGTDVTERIIGRIQLELQDRGHAARASRLGRLLARTGNATQLTPPDQIELADCLLPLYGPQEEPAVPGARYAAVAGRPSVHRIGRPVRTGLLASDPSPLPEIDVLQLLELWKRTSRDLAAASGAVTPLPDAIKSRPLNVPEMGRWALRATDHRVMKDWAFRVGRGGLCDLLVDVRSASPAASLHLVGHSHGCEALLAALSRGDKSASAETLLMLQPLMSAWALAPAPVIGPEVAPALQKIARGGAYRTAFESRVKRSIVATYGDGDWVANALSSRAVRRPSIDGFASPETLAAGTGIGGFTQLGAAGFGGMDPAARRTPLVVVTPPIAVRPERYPLEPDAGRPAVVAVDTAGVLRAHGEVNLASYWWLLADQVLPAN